MKGHIEDYCTICHGPGARYLVSGPGTWYQGPGNYLVPNIRYQGITWYQVPGTCYQVHGTRYLVSGTKSYDGSQYGLLAIPPSGNKVGVLGQI